MSWSGNGLALLRDERIAPLAVSALPAWLWSADASRILWANPTGAAIFGAATSSSIAARKFDAGQPAAAQIAQLAATLPADGSPQPVRLRGFGAGDRARADMPLLAHRRCRMAAKLSSSPRPSAPAPTLTLDERVSRLLAGCDRPVAIFSVDGTLIHATPAAASSFPGATSLAALGIETLADDALRAGHAAGETAHCPVRVDRLGGKRESVLLAAFAGRSEAEMRPAKAAEIPSVAPVEIIPSPPVAAEPSAPEVLQNEPLAAAASAATEPVEEAAGAIADAEVAPEAIEPFCGAATTTEPTHRRTSEPVEPSASVEPAPVVAEPVVTAAAEPVARRASSGCDCACATVAKSCRRTSDSAIVRAASSAPFRLADRRRRTLHTRLRRVHRARGPGAPPPCSDAHGRRSPTELGLDPEQRIAQALATRDTWSGLTVAWPIDDSADRLTVELSGLPSFDRDRQFRGYRGFGVCRDIARLNDAGAAA